MNTEKMAKAIEKDAGMELPGLRESIAEMKGGLGTKHTPDQILIKAARNKTGLSQGKFAKSILTPVATLRDWEQGRFPLPGAVTVLLKVILAHPEFLHDAA